MKKLLGLSTFLAFTINLAAWGDSVQFTLNDDSTTTKSVGLNIEYFNNVVLSSPNTLASGIYNHNYCLVSFTPKTTAHYSLSAVGAPGFYATMILYAGTFDPSSPGTNALIGNTNSQNSITIDRNLNANYKYLVFFGDEFPDYSMSYPIIFSSNLPGTFSPGDPTPTTTIQANLQPSALAIENFIILQDLNLLNNIKQDITGDKGWSFSTGGTYESVASFASQNTINLRANYLGDNHSFSSFINKNIDYNASALPIKTIKNVNFGGFITVNPTGIEKGLEVKLGVAGGLGDLDILREAIDGVTEPGSGISPYKSFTSLISGKYKINYKEKFALEPYLGLSLNQNNLSSYKEASNTLVTSPLIFQEINSENTILFSGIKTSHQVQNRLKLTYNVEINYDINPKITPLIATGLANLSPVTFKPSKMIRYLVGFKGLFDLSKSSALVLDVILQATPFEKKEHILMELGYKIHL
jgi:hypothetical protein